MPFIPGTDLIQLSAFYADQDGVGALNRHYCHTPSAVTPTMLHTACDTYAGFFDEVFKTVVNSNWKLVQLVARDMSEEFGAEEVFTDGLPISGTVGDTLNPNQVSATVTWQTGFVGRSFRGRTYHIGLPYSYVEPSAKQLSTTGHTALDTAYTGLQEAMSSAGVPFCVASFFEGGVPRTAAQITDIATLRVNFPLATQRRRLR